MEKGKIKKLNKKMQCDVKATEGWKNKDHWLSMHGVQKPTSVHLEFWPSTDGTGSNNNWGQEFRNMDIQLEHCNLYGKITTPTCNLIRITYKPFRFYYRTK